ncbi:MAG: nickel pincer cofactor biosynthesis protein LarC [Acidobacteria bacterium]|nr:MAG: nickel pincer cofactor biosynthesis protein LarC [Acidobacteriota bacterium]
MRLLYFDCFAGVSGDMTLGALVGAGAERHLLVEQLEQLDFSSFEIRFEQVDRSGISAVHAHVETSEQHHHRGLSQILKIIERSRLSAKVKERAARIFTRLGEAEARVHNIPVEQVHFHEVGALDAIVDVVGACIGFELLGIERFAASPLHVGSGMVEMAHGRFPVPPPAVVELLKGAPTYATEIAGELVTPTGAAIVSTLCESYGPAPAMRLTATGYGAGGRNYEKFPNVLRVLIGETETDAQNERLLMLETNVDDVSPQVIGHLMERAFQRGALDCYFTPVQMKKNRPGVLVSILCRPAEREALTQLLFSETTTLGVRSYEVERRALAREIVPVETQYGPVRIKVARLDGRISNVTPEYEDCRAAADRYNVPLRDVEAAARAEFYKTVTSSE